MASKGKLAALLVFVFGACEIALAEKASTVPPLVNWTAPAAYSPSGRSRIRTLSDISSPVPFIEIAPCRRYDTRVAGSGGPLLQGVNRSVTLTGGGPGSLPDCGIPASAVAVSVNITVFNISGALGNGVFKIDTVTPPAVAWINYPVSETQRANAGVVALNGSGQIVVQVAQGGGQVDFVVDTNGYYASAAANQGNTFTVINSGASAVPAILGQTNSASFNATGVKGVANSPTGVTNGVWGDSVSTSDGATGVFGFAEGTTGVTTGAWGRSVSSSDDSRGVYGENLATTGRTYGVYGYDASSGYNSAGVFGVSGFGSPPPSINFYPVGVRGESSIGAGVVGISRIGGTEGVLVDFSGTEIADGVLGTSSAGTNYGVYAFIGTIGCNGCTKQFVDPHPTDPSKTIHYVSLEGPEAGAYFRGSGRTIHGQAVIEVPDHFRWVTQEEGMTVQLTPVGELAMMAVISQDLNRIVVRSSKDVSFHYLVQGIRPAHRDFQPVIEGREYAPESANDRMKDGWPAWTKRRLVENGTYNADGTVNMETAERVGWTKIWAEREEEAKAATAKFAAERARE